LKPIAALFFIDLFAPRTGGKPVGNQPAGMAGPFQMLATRSVGYQYTF